MPAYRTPLPALFASVLQGGLNTVLALDPASSERMGKLHGRVLRLDLQGTGIQLFFTASDHGVEVAVDHPAGPESEPDTTVSGTPAALFTLAASGLDEGWSAPGSRVNISGDAGPARDFERLFSRLDADFEGLLAGVFGDVIGHQVAHGVKSGAKQARETAATAGEIAGEILREGAAGSRSGPLIGAGEARQFADAVDALRDAVERLEARIRLIDDSPTPAGDEHA